MYKTDRDAKNNIGNRVSKELTCTTHGYELRGGDCWREWGVSSGGGKGGKIGTTLNSTIIKKNFKTV